MHSVSAAIRAALLPLLVLALAGPGCAPSGPEAEPEPAGPTPSEQAARAFFDAFHQANWEACVKALHPEAVREFDGVLRPRLIAAAKANPQQEAQILALLPGVENLAALEAMSPPEFFRRFLESRVGSQPQTVQMLRASSTAILGEIAEGDDRRLVVYRMSGVVGQMQFEELGVLAVRRDGESWLPMLSDELKKLAQG